MRKVLVLVIGLILLSMFAACSEDSTQTTPPPATVDDISILTETVAGGYTCSPYTMTLEATGGVAPYTWSLAAGSALPEGLALASDGKIYGLCMNVGDYTFTARVVDSSDTPQSAEREYTLPVGVQSNPSVAVYYDEAASVCSASTGSWTWLKCYISILLEDSDVACATACEFKLRLTNVDGIDLEPGTDYAVTNTTTPDYVAFKIGDIFSGMAVGFNRSMYAPAPILVASFDILLLEDLENLSFKFEENPGGSLAIASCLPGYPMVQIRGREAALNY